MKGFTAIEVLIATAATLLIVTGAFGFARAERRVIDRESRALELREVCRRVAALIVREVREAGSAPAVGSFDGAADGLSFAAADRIEVRADRHGVEGDEPPDGESSPDSDERIAFFLSSLRGILYQSVGSQALPLTEERAVGPGGLRFSYFDACGRELVPPPGGGLSDAERRRVLGVAVALEASDRSGGTRTVEATVAIRSRLPGRCS